MYLLILKSILYISLEYKFTSHYVSINSFYHYHTQHLLNKFTSHYVSINSSLLADRLCTFSYLHPTMYLLIPNAEDAIIVPFTDLHPTMYLLILDLRLSYNHQLADLHPTMYLLIPNDPSEHLSQVLYLHPTMYLLILHYLFR